MSRKQELAKIAKEIKTIKAQLSKMSAYRGPDWDSVYGLMEMTFGSKNKALSFISRNAFDWGAERDNSGNIKCVLFSLKGGAHGQHYRVCLDNKYFNDIFNIFVAKHS